MKYWITKKINTDPGWKQVRGACCAGAKLTFLQLQVIFSDSSVPGEGEHKIMDWIRRQRSHADYDPNTSHVIYGLVRRLVWLASPHHF